MAPQNNKKKGSSGGSATKPPKNASGTKTPTKTSTQKRGNTTSPSDPIVTTPSTSTAGDDTPKTFGSLRKKKQARIAATPTQPSAEAVIEDETGKPKSVDDSNSFKLFLLENTDLEDAPAILVVENGGYFEYAMTDPIYQQRRKAASKEWVTKAECITRVINPIDPETGKKRVRPNPKYDPDRPTYYGKPGQQRKQPATWPVKCIGFPMDSGMTDEDIMDWFTTVFTPLILQSPIDMAMDTTPPKLHSKEPITRIKHWSDMLETGDITWILAKEYADECKEGLIEFFKQSQTNIYGCWPVGTVPMHVIKNHGLQKVHLHEDDWTKYVKSCRSEINNMELLDADDSDASSDGGDDEDKPGAKSADDSKNDERKETECDDDA